MRALGSHAGGVSSESKSDADTSCSKDVQGAPGGTSKTTLRKHAGFAILGLSVALTPIFFDEYIGLMSSVLKTKDWKDIVALEACTSVLVSQLVTVVAA